MRDPMPSRSQTVAPRSAGAQTHGHGDRDKSATAGLGKEETHAWICRFLTHIDIGCDRRLDSFEGEECAIHCRGGSTRRKRVSREHRGRSGEGGHSDKKGRHASRPVRRRGLDVAWYNCITGVCHGRFRMIVEYFPIIANGSIPI